MFVQTEGLPAGEHTLVLESFDKASDGVESALKTDTILIVILEPEPQATLATFTQSLEPVSITSGIESEWTLPDIDPGKDILTVVRLDADPLISQYLRYDSVANSVIYDGEEISSLSGARFVSISYTLVNNFGENLYTQVVSVLPNSELQSAPEPEQNPPTTEEPASSEVTSESIDEDIAAAANSNSAPKAAATRSKSSLEGDSS